MDRNASGGFGQSFGVSSGACLGVAGAIAILWWLDPRMGVAGLAGVLAIGGIIAWSVSVDARANRAIYNADRDAAAATRSRTYATLQAAEPGGNSPLPWAVFPGSGPAALPPPAADYAPDVLADSASYRANGSGR